MFSGELAVSVVPPEILSVKALCQVRPTATWTGTRCTSYAALDFRELRGLRRHHWRRGRRPGVGGVRPAFGFLTQTREYFVPQSPNLCAFGIGQTTSTMPAADDEKTVPLG
jgi:hypothetical protein